MSKQPDITFYEDKLNGGYCFEIMGDCIRVEKSKMERCCRDLGIRNTQGVFSSFRLICEWFIKEEQYVEFEEIK